MVMPTMTTPKVNICDLNKLCKRLLKSIKTPVNLNSSRFNSNLFSKSKLIFFIKSFLLRFS